MTTPQQTALQLAARHLVKAQEQTAKLGMMGAYKGHEIMPLVATLSTTLNDLGGALEAAGATYQPTDKPGASASFQAPASDPHGLEALRKIEESRKEGEALARCLQATLVVAEALDKRRGNWVGDAAHTEQGETPGTNYAEAVQELVLRLRGELGVEGSGRE